MHSSDLLCLIWCDRDGWLCMMKHCFSVLILQPSASTCRCSSASFSIPLFSFTVPSVRSRLTQKSRTLRRKVWRIPFIDLKPEGSKQEDLHLQLSNSAPQQQDRGSNVFSSCRNLFKLFIFDAVVGVWSLYHLIHHSFKTNYFINDPLWRNHIMFQRQNKTSRVIL